MPVSNRGFWAAKIAKNTRRDRVVKRALRKEGVKVVRIWEHDLRLRTQRLRAVIDGLELALRKSS